MSIQTPVIDRSGDRSPTRRELARLLGGGAMAAAFGAVPRIGWASRSPSTFQALGLNHLAVRVTDPARSAEFYRQHLGMEVILDRSFGKFMGCGPNFIALFGADEPGLGHFAVTVPDYDQTEAAERLRGVGLEPRLEENRTYFRDPDGLEIQLDSATSWPGPGERPR